MGTHPDPDLEAADDGSNISLNHLIRAEVRAAVQAEVTASLSASSPPAYSSSTNAPSASRSRSSSSSPQVTPSIQLTQKPIGWYRVSLALLPWLIIFSTMSALCLTIDKQAISALAFFLVVISYAASIVLLMVLGLTFKESFAATPKKIPSANDRRQGFVFFIWISWQCLLCYCLFGYVVYWYIFERKHSMGKVYRDAKTFEGLVGVDGAIGTVVQCLQGRLGGTGASNVTIADLDICFSRIGMGGL